MEGKLEVVIVGGVAGGASAAARLRRLSEHIGITMFEMAGSISFGTCGMPYYLGGVVDDRNKLFLTKAEDFKKQFNVDIILNTKVVKIDREKQEVHFENLQTGEKGTKKYDRLLLATGAKPNALPISGIDLPGVFSLRGARDMDKVHDYMGSKQMKKVVLIGAGMIGMELAENMIKKGIADVTIVEAKNQVGGPLDFEIAHVLQVELAKHGVKVILNEFVTAIASGESGALTLTTKSGQKLDADIVIVGVGVSPDTALAVEAGLELGTTRAIKVDDNMRTSDPNIYAVGDVIEVKDFITGIPVNVPLAGPASRQGRIAADNICGRNSKYRGTQGTSIVGVFDTAAAITGCSEKWLQYTKTPYLKAYVHPNDHVAYYPGAKLVSVKILFSPDTGKLLGGQVVGLAAVDKEIDVLAIAIQAKMTVYDLEEVELAYAPAYGSPKSPINMAGFVGAGMLRGDQKHVYPEVVVKQQTPVLLDVRPEAAWKSSGVPGSLNIPLGALRTRMSELPKDQQIIVVCFQGKTAYNGFCILKQHGYDAIIMAGGVTTYNHTKPGVQ